MEIVTEKTGGLPTEAIFKWWHEIQPDQEMEGQPNRRGELAELRRCKTLAEIFLVPRFQLLRRIVHPSEYLLPACASIAGILAHVKTNDAKHTFAQWLALPKAEGSGPRLSELRFRRLVRIKNYDDLFIDLIRVLPLAADTAPVKQLAEDIYWWNDYTRRQWTFDYYDVLAEGE
jgi:CRISPR system Cascade subunit CasB